MRRVIGGLSNIQKVIRDIQNKIIARKVPFEAKFLANGRNDFVFLFKIIKDAGTINIKKRNMKNIEFPLGPRL